MAAFNQFLSANGPKGRMLPSELPTPHMGASLAAAVCSKLGRNNNQVLLHLTPLCGRYSALCPPWNIYVPHGTFGVLEQIQLKSPDGTNKDRSVRIVLGHVGPSAKDEILKPGLGRTGLRRGPEKIIRRHTGSNSVFKKLV